MVYKYTAKADEITTAKGVGRDLSISTKQSIEICNMIRGMTVEKAKKFLEQVTKKEAAVKMARFNSDTGHKPGMGPGRYPIKACTEILDLVKTVESNAQYKGLAGDLIVETIVPHKGSGNWHYGRQRRRKMKRTTVEVILKETAPAKKEEKKVEVKKEATVKETPKESPKPIEKKAIDAPASKPVEKKEEAKVEVKKEVPKEPVSKPEEKVEEKKEAPSEVKAPPVPKVEEKKEVPVEKEAPKEPVKPIPKVEEKKVEPEAPVEKPKEVKE